MFKMKKIISLSLTVAMCASMATISSASENNNYDVPDPNQVISIHEDVHVPNNVTLYSYPVTYDHNSEIVWDRGYRQVKGDTQAKQGTINISSYTRARFESWPGGVPYADSGRQWSDPEGSRSRAESGWELYSALDSGIACTYYGIED